MNLFAPEASGSRCAFVELAAKKTKSWLRRSSYRAISRCPQNCAKILLLAGCCLLGMLSVASAATVPTSSVTLAWDPPLTGSVADYKVYYGTGSQQYSGSVSAGTSTKATLTGLLPGSTYYFVATAVDAAGQESIFSNEITYRVPATNPAPFLTLNFPATGGVISGPFVTNNGALYQSTTTDVNSGGRAVYYFNLADGGDYTLKALVNGPNAVSNSFFVNIDAEPTSANVWAFPLTAGFVSQTVTWPGVGTKIFTLAAGVHQLIVIGKDANTQLKGVTLVPVLARLDLRVTATKQAILSGTGKPLHTYQAQYSQNLISWTVLGNVTTDATGAWQLTDPTPATAVARSYRLRDPSP